MSMSERGAGGRRRFPVRRRADRRAVYLLPNLITTASLMLGFWSIVQAAHLNFNRAAWGIVLAGICDMLDGRIARATRSTSRFGVEYDSITDMVSFGVAPAFLVYNWVLLPLGPRGWVVASLFAVCAAMRLARFNVQQNDEERVRYQGLPSTSAGGMVAVIVWFVSWLGIDTPLPRGVGLGVAVGFVSLALLMVSGVPYPSWKSLPLSGRHAFPTLVALVLGLLLLLLYGEPAFFGIAATYVASGPALWLASLRKRHTADAAARVEESAADV